MMTVRVFPFFFFACSILVLSGCSNVKVALYDKDKRAEYAIESKKAFSNSPAGKEMALKNSMIETAKDYVGTKYKYGSYDPKQGFDCSGLVYFVAKQHQLELPRSSSTLAAAAPHIPWKKAGPGDLVFFGDRGRINHVAIIERIKPDELWVIHSTTQRGVYEENVLVSSYWKKRILFAVDFTTLHDKVKKVKS
jgi:cell wall-associated NlpC family hydrolase